MRGAWVEIITAQPINEVLQSLPVRGAWVEMSPPLLKSLISVSLPVRGAWVEIIKELDGRVDTLGRSPCGERGLKLTNMNNKIEKTHVAPRAGSVG